MAPSIGKPDSPVITPVESGTDADDFFDQVRVLEAAFPETARVGEADSLKDEIIRFHASSQLCFAAREVESVHWDRLNEDHRRCHLTVTFLGLLGAMSPLPGTYLREMIDDEDRGDAPRLREFLDLFNHRIIGLYYRAWKKYRGYLQVDATAQEKTTSLMLALGGQDADLARSVPGEDAGDELRSLMPMLGPLARRVRSAAAVESCVQVLLDGAPVEVRPWIPRWVEIPERQVCRLGGTCSRLGVDLTLGDRIRDRSGRCEVRVGPVDLELFRRLYPGESSWGALRRLLVRSLPNALEYQLVVILAEEQTGEPLALGESAGRLGVDTWLSEAHGRDLEVLFPPAVASGVIAPPGSGGEVKQPTAPFGAAEPKKEAKNV
jgi:type VI secretion system protein ImpH